MNLPVTDNTDPVIQAFSIRADGSVQIDFWEKHETTPRAFHLHSLVAEADVISNLDDIVEDLQEALRDIQVYIRNPAPSFREGEPE